MMQRKTSVLFILYFFSSDSSIRSSGIKPVAGAFAFGMTAQKQTSQIKKDLLETVDGLSAEQEFLLQVHLDVGNPEEERLGGSRMNIQGLQLQFSGQSCIAEPATATGSSVSGTRATSDGSAIVMPGSVGSDSHLSTGSRLLRVVQHGTYINMEGTQCVDVGKSAQWELIWKDHAPAGTLICGFHLDRAYHRNDASLPSGPFFINFSVWSRLGLWVAQEYQSEAKQDVEVLLQRRSEVIRAMKQSWNPVEKAWLVQQCKGLEAQIQEKVPIIQDVPPSDKYTVALPHHQDLILSKRGFVFRPGADENMAKQGQYERVGYAYCSQVMGTTETSVKGEGKEEKTGGGGGALRP